MDLVDRTITILEKLAQHPNGIGVVNLATTSELAPSTVHRYLTTLQERHIVEQTKDKRYRLTSRLYLMGLAANERFDLKSQAQATLEQVAQTSQETTCLMVRDEAHAVCVAQVDSLHPLKITARVGSRQDLRVGATSRVLLAHAPADLQDHLLEQTPITQRTPNTVTDSSAVRAILERIRQEGYYVSHGEIDEGVVAVAAPVRNQEEEVIGSLVIAAPEARARDVVLERLIELVTSSANDISRKLGYALAHPAKERTFV